MLLKMVTIHFWVSRNIFWIFQTKKKTSLEPLENAMETKALILSPRLDLPADLPGSAFLDKLGTKRGRMMVYHGFISG